MQKNTKILDSKVLVEEFAVKRGDIEYRATVDVDYSYEENDD